MTCEMLEYCSPYLLGLLDEGDVARYERHLGQDCAECEAELAALGETVAQAASTGEAPDPAVKVKLLKRIAQESAAKNNLGTDQVWKKWKADTAAGLWTLRADEGAWETVGITGIAVKRLFTDAAKNSVTMLVRMDAGTSYPMHRHAGVEECLVLEGDLHVGESIVLKKGDYQRAGEDSLHVRQWTEGGCLLFIVSSMSDELLE